MDVIFTDEIILAEYHFTFFRNLNKKIFISQLFLQSYGTGTKANISKDNVDIFILRKDIDTLRLNRKVFVDVG